MTLKTLEMNNALGSDFNIKLVYRPIKLIQAMDPVKYDVIKLKCSDNAINNKKNIDSDNPTIKYWSGWMDMALNISNIKKAINVKNINKFAYFTARSLNV